MTGDVLALPNAFADRGDVFSLPSAMCLFRWWASTNDELWWASQPVHPSVPVPAPAHVEMRDEVAIPNAQGQAGLPLTYQPLFFSVTAGQWLCGDEAIIVSAPPKALFILPFRSGDALSYRPFMPSIQIVAPDYSGMTKDVEVIRDALAETQHEIVWGVPSELNMLQKLVRKSRILDARRHHFRLNILIQAPFKWMIQDAAKNCLIPNPEWLSDTNIGQLRHVSEVWCKTKSAVEVFGDLGCKTRFIGFSGRDVYDPVVSSRRGRSDRCLHVSGSNAWKGTQVLLDTWLMHPEWPHLTIVCRVPIRRPATLPANVTFEGRRVPEKELRALLNSCGVNIQPTEMEGYGHSLAEAMSVKAVVLVTNGAPMNERVDAGQVVFIEPARQQPHYRGRRYFVTPSSIEAAMEAVLNMREAQRSEMGEAARRTFLAERAVLPRRLRDAVAAVI